VCALCGVARRVPANHSNFSKNRRGHFRDGDLLRDVFERVVEISLTVGLIKGESFVVDDVGDG
jgi:hypothetical protein